MSPPTRILVAVPTPPPFAGPEINGRLLLDSGLGDGFELHHVRMNVATANRVKGKFVLSSLLRGFQLWLTLLRLLVTKRPKILYFYLSQNLSGFTRDMVVVLTAAAVRVKIVAHVRGGGFRHFYETGSALRRLLIRFVVRRFSRLVLLGELLRPQFSGLLAEEKMCVIHNALPAAFDVGDATRDERFTVLYVGHLSRAKGFEDFMRALPAVVSAIPTVRVVVAGEWLETEANILHDEQGRPLARGQESLCAMWADLAARFGGNFSHVGVVAGDAKSEAFARASVFVLPSYSEGFPMTVLEAMAAALPVVVTPVGAIPDVLRDGENALFIEPGHPEQIAGALIRLAGDSALRARMGESNRALLERELTYSTVQRRLRALFTELLEPAGAAAARVVTPPKMRIG